MSVPAPFGASPASGPVLVNSAPIAAAPPAEPHWVRWATLAIAVALGLAVLSPLLKSYWFDSHEDGRYLVRLVEFVRGWREGHLYPRWAPDTDGGYGSPLFVFRPPVLFVLAAPFLLFGASLATALKIAVALFSAAGAAGAYLLAFGETRRPDASLVAAAAWVFAPYRFVDLFMRGDLTEYAAVCLFPLVLWLYRELGRVPRQKIARTATLAALAHAALILAHTIMGQWSTELLFLLSLPAIVASFRKADRARLWAYGLSFTFALGLGAAYLIPALAEKNFAPRGVAEVTSGYALSTGHLVPLDLFFRFGFFEFSGDGMLGDPHRMPFSIGIPAAAALGLGLAGILWRQPVARRLGPWLGTIAGLLFVMSPAAIGLWPAMPFGRFIQFPWRLLGLVLGASVCLVGLCWELLVPWARWRYVLCTLALGLIALDGSRFVREQPGPYRDDINTETIRAAADVGIDDIPPGVPPSSHRSTLLVFSGPIQGTATQPVGTEYDIQVQAKGPGLVDLQTFWFPCWQIVEQHGPMPVTLARSPASMVRLSVPAAGGYRMKIEFRPTWVFRIAALISLLSAVLLWPSLRLTTRQSAPG